MTQEEDKFRLTGGEGEHGETPSGTSAQPPPDDAGSTPARHPGVSAEPETLPRKLIIEVLAGSVAVGVALALVALLIMWQRLAVLRPSGKFPEQSLPAPRKVAEVREEMFDVPRARPTERQVAGATLEHFGWVDRKNRIVHVPIQAAMDFVARGGLHREEPHEGDREH